MFCPKCGAEFREGFTECNTCHIPLLPHLPARDSKKAAQAEPEVLYTVTGTLDAEMLCELLRREGIAAYVREQTLGQGARLYTGASYFGTDILIDRADRERACAVLSAYLAQAEASVDDEELARQALQEMSPEETVRQREQAKTQPREKWHICVFRWLLTVDQLLTLLLTIAVGVLAVIRFALHH